MKAQRRAKEAAPTADARWRRVGEEDLQRSIHLSLGIRPEAWWAFDSGRPDLAEGAVGDVYVHLRTGGADEPAEARFRFLVETGQLAESERLYIIAGSGPRYDWRRRIIAAHSLRVPA